MDQLPNRKRWIIAGIIVAGIYFSPILIRSTQQMALALFAPKPKPVAIAAVTKPSAPVPAPNPEAIPQTRISGKWKGNTLVANRGRCEVNLEITPDSVSPNHYSGALSQHCLPAVMPFWGKVGGAQAVNNSVNAITPVNAILSGTATSNSLPFNVDKSITGTCPITAATVTPFGSQQLAFEWKDDCGNGDMILFR